MRIDAHQHFWTLGESWFEWPTPDLAAIHRDYAPGDLAPLLERGTIDGTVLVQVAAQKEETVNLLGIAEGTDFVRAVVGWVDLEARGAVADIERFRSHPKFRGVRPMIQAISDVDWMLRPKLEPALKAAQHLGLTFDALVKPQHLAALAVFADRYPNLPIVVDHGAKPEIAHGREGFERWAPLMTALAERPNVCCKVSGLLTEAGGRRGASDLAPFVDHLLDVFGPERLMWGSDWPVVELAVSYEAWLEMARSYFEKLSPDEQDAVFGGVACNFYRL